MKLLKNTKNFIKDIAVKLDLIDGERIDVWILSYPKSGRTWLRTMMGKTLCDHFELDQEKLLRTDILTEQAGLPVTLFSHGGSALRERKTWNELETDKSRYKRKKVIYLVRQPHDVVVSSYFHAKNRFKIYDDSISQFIRDDRYGIRKIANFTKIWFDNQNIPKDFLFLHYEDIHENPLSCLQNVFNFIDENHNIPLKVLENAVEFSSFKNMKKMETAGSVPSNTHFTDNVKDSESYKVRKGKVGGYVDYLSSEDIEFIDKVLQEINYPFINNN